MLYYYLTVTLCSFRAILTYGPWLFIEINCWPLMRNYLCSRGRDGATVCWHDVATDWRSEGERDLFSEIHHSVGGRVASAAVNISVWRTSTARMMWVRDYSL